jgi:cysteine desulfurase
MGTGEIVQVAAGGKPAGPAGQSVYLDYNATTPVDPRVLEIMLPYLDTHFGNPSSAHSFGLKPHAALERARAQVAALIGAAPAEILFTGSGSEADATAIRGVATAAIRSGVGRPHVIAQATEHPAVLAACDYVRDCHGAEVTVLGVDAGGSWIAELAGITRGHGALFHTDAAQAVGKIPVNVTELGVDLLTLVGHKFYAPKGVGALYVREGVALEALIGGGGQEQGRRGGTENVPYAVALGAAAELAAADLAAGSADRLAELRDRLQRELQLRLPGRAHANGSDAPRLPQTLNISIDGTLGHAVLSACPNLAASTGSACHDGTHRPSPVLSAMGVDEERGLAALRLTLGRWSTEADVLIAAKAIIEAAG